MDNRAIQHTHSITEKILSEKLLRQIKETRLIDIKTIKNVHTQIIHMLREEVFEVYTYVFNNFSENVNIENFQYYIDDDLITEIENSFPMLSKLLEDKYNNVIDYINSMLSNVLHTAGDTGITKINHIYLNNGDHHNKGQSTLKIVTNLGNYFYKPRSSYVEKAFNDFVSTFINDCTYKIYNFGNFSLCEQINYLSPTKKNDIELFFYNQGIISALLYYLNSSDNHYENIIVNKNFPYYIDLECFYMHRSNNKLLEVQENFIKNVDSTIFRTGIFPVSISDSYMNISALTGRKENIINPYYKYKDYNIEKTNISSEFIEVKTMDQKNLVRVNGEIVEPIQYLDQIKKGFKDISDKIIGNKEFYIEQLLKIVQYDTAKFRYIYRPTHIYDRVLKLLREPYYRVNTEKAKRAVLSIQNERLEENTLIHEYEIEELLNSDIPIFYAQDRNLVLGNGHIILNYFDTSLSDSICNNIYELTNEKISTEIENITKSLYLNDFNSNFSVYQENEYKSYVNSSEELRKFGEKFIGNDYLHVSYQNSIATISSANSYLYEGGGLLLSNLIISNGKNKNIINFLNSMKKKKMLYVDNISITNGIGSHLFILFTCHTYFNNEKYYIKEIEKTLNILIKKIDKEDSFNIDYFSGLSGVLTLLNKMYSYYENISDTNLINLKLNLYLLITKIKETLLHTDTNIIGAGMAHGLSGIIYSLYMTFKNFPEKDIKTKILSLIDQEETFFIKQENNYIDSRTNDVAGLYFCYGIPGILQCRMRLSSEFRNDNNIQLKLDQFINDLSNDNLTLPNNLSLCHGMSNVIDLLIDAYRFNFISKSQFIKSTQLMKNKIDNLNIAYSNYNLNFGLGISGYFYTLLRTNNINYPSIFFLEYSERGVYTNYE